MAGRANGSIILERHEAKELLAGDRIMFPEGTGADSLGRNGYISTIGVQVYATSTEVVIAPVRMTGVLGRSYVGIVRDRDTLRKIARRLTELADSLSSLLNGGRRA